MSDTNISEIQFTSVFAAKILITNVYDMQMLSWVQLN